MSDEPNRPEGHTPVPESFPLELLAQPVGARLEYFEQRCLISHPRLQEALETIIQAVTPPGEGASVRRPGTMVLVIGPSRVGKTTLIRMLEERLLAVCQYSRRRAGHQPLRVGRVLPGCPAGVARPICGW